MESRAHTIMSHGLTDSLEGTMPAVLLLEVAEVVQDNQQRHSWPFGHSMRPQMDVIGNPLFSGILLPLNFQRPGLCPQGET